MKTIVSKIEGDFTVAEDIVLQGMVTGNITVARGGSLNLQGLCCKSLFVESGGDATIRGTVNADVVNRGGTVTIHDIVNGAVREESGETHIAAGAVVHNRSKA